MNQAVENLPESEIRSRFGLFMGVYMHRVRGSGDLLWRPLPGHDWEWYKARVAESALRPQHWWGVGIR